MGGGAPDLPLSQTSDGDAVIPTDAGTDVPVSASPEPAAPSGWIQPGADSGPSPGVRRVLSTIVWVFALLSLAFAGWVSANGRETETSTWRIAYVAAAVLGGLAIGILIRWAWLRVRRYRGIAGSGASLVSNWIPVVAIVIASSLVGSALVKAFEPPGPVDPATMFRAGSEYSFSDADPSIAEYFRTELEAQSYRPRALAVTQVDRDDGATGTLVVVDVGIAEVFSDLALEGLIFGLGTETTPRHESVAGRNAVFSRSEDVTIVGWIDAPLIAILYGPDDATARSMVESVIVANEK